MRIAKMNFANVLNDSAQIKWTKIKSNDEIYITKSSGGKNYSQTTASIEFI